MLCRAIFCPSRRPRPVRFVGLEQRGYRKISQRSDRVAKRSEAQPRWIVDFSCPLNAEGDLPAQWDRQCRQPQLLGAGEGGARVPVFQRRGPAVFPAILVCRAQNGGWGPLWSWATVDHALGTTTDRVGGVEFDAVFTYRRRDLREQEVVSEFCGRNQPDPARRHRPPSVAVGVPAARASQPDRSRASRTWVMSRCA